MSWPTHTRIATVFAADRKEAVAMIQGAQGDVIEVRFDALWPAPPDADEAADDLIAITEATQRPILATLRPTRQGGLFEGSEEARINLLFAAAQAGCAVDIENEHIEVAEVLRPFREGGMDILLSDHRFTETPSRETGLKHLQSMQDLLAEREKIAFPVGSFMDGLRALELAHSHAHRSGSPIITPIGGDPLLRPLLPLAGNHGTYGHAGKEAVSGQPAMSALQETWDHWGIDNKELPGDPDAGWFAVVGDPVAHSLSPRIHNAMLRAEGAAQRYGALTVPDSIGAMRLLATVAPRIGLRGCSVTMPLKHHALAIAAPDDTAKETGAANCLRFTDGAEATNTDATAMRRLLASAGSVAVLGAGGAARAALWAAAQSDLPVSFSCRDAEKGRAIAAETGAGFVPWDQRRAMEADTWVQATPAIDATDTLPGVELAIELVYGQTTTFSQAASEAGARVVDGKAFLIEQALDAYRFWTGRVADRHVMEAVL